MRTIDADALIESIKRQCNFCRLTADDELIQQFIDVLEKGFIEEVDNAPTIEPKRGEWIVHSNGKMCDCSVCNESYDRTFEYVDEWNFCPNCGCAMTKE